MHVIAVGTLCFPSSHDDRGSHHLPKQRNSDLLPPLSLGYNRARLTRQFWFRVRLGELSHLSSSENATDEDNCERMKGGCRLGHRGTHEYSTCICRWYPSKVSYPCSPRHRTDGITMISPGLSAAHSARGTCRSPDWPRSTFGL
jgi:hypothetical protein